MLNNMFYLYRTPPIDDFSLYTRFDDALILMKEKKSKIDLCKFLMMASLAIDAHEWDRDLRSMPYVLFIPDPDECSSRLGLIIKQENNGNTYIFSPVEISWAECYLLNTGENNAK